MNPFIIKDYAGPAYFCNRTEETERIENSIKNERNLTISSIRKMGKTGLIKHVMFGLDKSGKYETIYLDIYDTQNIGDFINKFGTALLSKTESFSRKISRMADTFIKSIRPKISYDPLTGAPSFSFFFDPETKGEKTLQELFAFLGSISQEKQFVIAIDEFQQITEYPETNLEAALRSNISNLHNVQFIFSGSNKHLLASIFSSAKRPFYQSTELMNLEEISSEAYGKFIADKFKQLKIRYDKEAIQMILRWTKLHTYYVQYTCNKIAGNEIEYLDEEEVKKIFLQILTEYEPFYYEYRNMLTLHQWKLVTALARESGISQVTSGVFMQKYGLSTASTIRRGIKALLEKEVIYNKAGSYYVYDVFFSNWLEWKYAI
ncbi:MAG: ATP-binding protein [Bacteroidetes bacterium]|nr:ATP-binding protein [Bacteroidota bacterium]